jgi:hypothetical protein
MEPEVPVAYSNMPRRIAIPEMQPKAGPLTGNGTSQMARDFWKKLGDAGF